MLNARDLVVEVTGAGNGQTAIRVDAQVSWQPPRPGSDRVPSAARVVTITQLPSLDRTPAPARAVTITGPAVVRRLAELVARREASVVKSRRIRSAQAAAAGSATVVFFQRLAARP